MKKLNNPTENFVSRRINQRRVRRWVALLSALVLFLTVNTLKLEADTLERVATCGIEQHVHDESCYDASGALICGLAEHAHTDACFQQRPQRHDLTRVDGFMPLNAKVTLATPMPKLTSNSADGQDAVQAEADYYSDIPTEVGSGIEPPVDEIETELAGEDAAPAVEDAVPLEIVYEDQAEETVQQPEYVINGSAVLLSDILSALGMKASGIQSAGELEGDTLAEAPVNFAVEATQNDYELRVLRDFDAAELGVVTADEVIVITLKNGIAPVEDSDDENPSENDDINIEETHTEETDEEAAADETVDEEAEDSADELTENADDEETGEASDEATVDETEEEAVETVEETEAAAVVPEKQIALDFADYDCLADATVYFYAPDRAAVLVNAEELAEADGVHLTVNAPVVLSMEADLGLAELEAALEEAPEDIDARIGENPVLFENGVLIISGDGELTVNGVTYTVTNLTLPARSVESDNITISTVDDQATLLGVTPAFEDNGEDEGDIYALFAASMDEHIVTATSEEIQIDAIEPAKGLLRSSAMMATTDAAPEAEEAVADAEETAGTETTEAAVETRTLRVRVYDVSLIREGESVEPDAPIHVETTFDAPLEGENFQLYHIVDGKPEEVDGFVKTDDQGRAIGMSFDTASLSPFAVVYYTVEYTTDNNEVTVKLDFTDIVKNGVDFDTNSVITALNDGVSVSISELEQGYIEGTDSVVNGELYIDYTTDDNKNENIKNVNWIGFKVVSVDEGLTVADGKIKVTKDGTVVLSDGISTINIVISNYTRLVAEELSASGVDIEVLDGSVPAGSKVVYAEHSEEETQALVSEYNIEATDTVGAFDVSIAMPEGDAFKEEGSFKVSVDAPAVEVPEGAVAVYKLYHIHEGQAEKIEAEVTDGKLSFVTNSFSDFVYTVDFEYTDPVTGETIAWKGPGRGSYAIASIMKEIGVEGEISDVTLVRTDDIGGDASVLYLEEKEDGWYLTSETAFQDTFKLSVTVNNIVYTLIVTDDNSAVNKGTSIEAFFVDDHGVRQDEVSVKSGEPINARVVLQTASATTAEPQYVKLSLNGLGQDNVTMTNSILHDAWSSVTIRDSTTHEYINIGVYYDTAKNEIIYRVPPGATAIVPLSFTTPNGITPNGTTITLTPSKCDEHGNPATPADNDVIGAPVVGTWTSEFKWDPVNKTVNNVKANTISAFAEDGHVKLSDWLVYNHTANSLNNATVGVRWTDEITITDTLTLPPNVSFPDSAGITKDGNNLKIGSDIFFGLTLNENMTFDSWQIEGKTLTYTVTVKNTKRDSTSGELTGEMPNLSYQAEMNLSKLALPDDYISGNKYGEKITNKVTVTEKPDKGEERPTSNDTVETTIKASDGYKVEKESTKDGKQVKAGDTIDYKVILSNIGSLALGDDALLEDQLPNTVTVTDAQKNAATVTIYSSASDTTGTPGDKTKLVYDSATNKLTYDPSGLPAGSKVVITFDATVKDAQALQDLNVQNNDTVTNYVHYKAESSYVSSRIHKGHLNVKKLGTTTAVVDDKATVGYTIAVTKDGGEVVPSTVTLVDQLPPYLQLKVYKDDGNKTPYTMEELYDGTAKTLENVYIKSSDSDSNYPWTEKYRHVNVTITADGKTSITANMADYPQYYGYEVVFNAGKVGESGATVSNGVVTYDNVATTTTGDNDHEQFQGKTGEVGIEKYWDAAELEGTPVTQQPFEDATIVTYKVKVTNDADNPYNYAFDVTDAVPAGLFPMDFYQSDGTTAITSNAELAAYLQTGEGGHVNKLKAAKLNGEDVQVRFNNNGIEIVWTVANSPVIKYKTYTYRCKVITDDLNMAAEGTKILRNTVKTMGKEDYEEIEVHVHGVTPKKEILDGNNRVEDIGVGPGETTTYILTIENEGGKQKVLTDVKDFFPYGGQITTSYWVLGETVFVETADSQYNQFVANVTGTNSNKYWMNSGNLNFDTITVPEGTTSLQQKVSLKWPEDVDKFRSFWTDQWNRKSKNQFYINQTYDEVDHHEKTDKKYYMQKSVLALSDRTDPNNPVKLTSKDLFRVNSATHVYYMLAFLNTGTGTLHINELKDILPPELEFVGMTGSDYSAGAWDYSNVGSVTKPITTSAATNNPSYVASGYSSVSDQTVSASVNGNTVTFSINDGAGVDLAEKQMIYLDIMCKFKDDADLSNVQALTNTMQADVDKDAELKKTSVTTKGTPSDSIQNNGTCEEVAEGDTTKTAQSAVTIHPLEIAVPGIKKQAVAYKGVGAANWNTNLDHLTNIKDSQSNIKWEITLYNDGTVDLDQGYTLEDDLFWFDHFSEVESFKIYNVGGSVIRTPSVGDPVPSRWTSIASDGEYRHYTWTFDNRDEYVIPAGGKAVLTIITTFESGNIYQGQLDNKAIFEPVQSWDANRVIHGQLEKNPEGDTYIGVSSSDYVNMYGAGATVSYKAVQEKDNADNIAYGYNINIGQHKIEIEDKTDLITYTNFIKNLSDGAFRSFVLIDRMPDLNDVGAQNAKQSRGSEFPIHLAGSISLKLQSGDGHTKLNLTADDYTIQYKNQDPSTAFTNDDWDGVSAWSNDPTGANAFRIVLNPASLTAKINALDSGYSFDQAVFPAEWTLEVSYDAELDPTASWGQTAYNSFGYRYKESGGTTLEAEPPMVGVTIPKRPIIRKIVLDDEGKELGVDETKTFTFTFYEGTYTPEQIAAQNPAVLWQTQVYQGQALQLPVKATVNGTTTGYFEDGKNYTVVETPVDGYSIFKYEVDGLTQTTKNYSNFKFDSSTNTTVVAFNLKKSGFTPEAEKTLKGRALQDQEFEFELYEVENGTPKATPIQTVKNDGEGKVKFKAIDYDQAGTYKYQIKEKIGSDGNIYYDDTVYELTVVVTQQDDITIATGTYTKVGGGTVDKPTFENEVVTGIEVEKKWAGDVESGTATMVLYRTSGENAAKPTDKFTLNISATLDHTTSDNGSITVNYSGSNGDTGSVTLNNQDGWTNRVVTLNRNETYTFTYVVDGNKVTAVTGTNPEVLSGISNDTEEINLTATAVEAKQYTYTFNVPAADRAENGKINVTLNGTTKVISASSAWKAEFTVAEDAMVTYSAEPGNGFYNAVALDPVTPASATGDVLEKNITVTASKAATTMTVPVSVTWDNEPDAGTSVVVTLARSDGGALKTVTLTSANTVTGNAKLWSTNETLDRLDNEGNLLTWTPTAVTSVPEDGAAATITNSVPAFSDTGVVAYMGEVAKAMNLTIIVPITANVNFQPGSNIFDKDKEFLRLWNDFDAIYVGGTNYSKTYSDLEVKNSDGELYYGISVYNSPYKVTTNAKKAEAGVFNFQGTLYIKAQPGDVTVTFENTSGTSWVIENGSANPDTLNAAPLRKSTKAFAGPLTVTPKMLTKPSGAQLMGNAAQNETKFYDPQVETSPTPDYQRFTAIQAKDLPSGAEMVPDTELTSSETTTGTVTVNGNGTKKWTNLPTVDEDGNPIYYYVVEKDATAVADEMSVRYSYDYNADGTISKVTITNTPVKNTTYIDVSASKQWKLVDGTNMSAFNGAKVEFTLLKNGVKVESADMNGQANPIEITGASGTAKWTNLEEGDFNYTVKETKITLPDNTVYTSDEDIAKFTANQVVSNGGTIDNIAKTKISASKEWKNAAGDVFTGTAIPANLSVKFTLMKDSTETNKSVTLTGATTTGDSYENSWTAHFTNLDKYNADGTAAVYTVKETVTQTGYSVEGSDTASDGGKITNREDHGNLEVTKSVTGLGSGETTPANYPVVILAEKDSKVYYIKNNNKTFVELSGVSSVDAVTAETLTGKEGWQWDVPTAANSKLTVENLPLGSYTVVEILSEAQKIIGNYELQTGTSTTSDTEEITANGQTASFSLENKYDKKQAKLVVTKTQINPPEGLDNSKLKFTIKPNSQANRLTLTDFDTAADGSITVPYSSFTNDSLTLDQNNGVVQGETYTVTEAWDGYVEGNVTITSTVQATGEGTATTASSKQVTVGASEMTVAFTNTYTVKIYAKKTWTQGSASMTAWPKDQKVTFQLQEKTDGDKWVDVENQGKVISSFEVVNWDNLPANKTYRVVETKVNETVLAPAIVATGDGKTEGTAFVINNDVTTSVEVDKKWFAADGTTEITETIQNASIKVQLKNGETTVVQNVDGVAFGEAGTVTLNGSETPKWHYKWDKLPKYDAEGNEIDYMVFEVEAKVNTNDTLLATTGTPKIATKGESDEKFHLENTLPKTERHATKIWVDSNNAKGKRPDSITFTLTAKADGEEKGMDAEKLRAEGITNVTKTIGIREEWKADWSDLPVYTKDGKLITYGVEETAVEYYTTLISELDDTTKTWTITNKLGDASQTLTGKKVMAQGQTPGTYSFTLTAVDNAPMPTGFEKDEQGTSSLTVQNSGETITFGTIDFTLQDMRKVEGGYDDEKTFSYTVKEVTGDSAGVVYDTKVYTASITVHYDSANGTLTAEAPTYTVKASAEAETSESANEIVFTNDDVVTVEATKIWKKNDTLFKPANASVTLELQQSVDNGTDWTKVTATEADNTTANPATITASGTALEQWKASWTNLPKFTKVTTGEEPNQTTVTVEIQYRVIETAATLDGRTVTPTADTTKAVTIDSQTAKGTAEFTNKVTEFSFTKEWYDSVDALNTGNAVVWPMENGAEIPITLTLTRKLKEEGGTEHEDSAFNGTITATPSNSTINVQKDPNQWDIGIEKENGEGYTFKVRYLPTDGTLQDSENTYTGTWVYYIAEDQVTNYNTPAYYYQNEGQWSKREGATAGHNGDKIVNSKTMSFELPSTGGPGTTGLYIVGSILTLLALVLLITKKRTEGQGID